MRKILLMCLLLFIINSTAVAGVKPEPFRVSLVKLDNVSTALQGSNRMYELLRAFYPPDPGIDGICHPPDPGMDVLPVPRECTITPDELAEQLRNQAKQVQRMEEQVYDITKHPPDPGLADYLRTVRSGAASLIANIDTQPPPDDNKVTNANDKLRRNLQSLVDMIDAHLVSNEIPPGEQ